MAAALLALQLSQVPASAQQVSGKVEGMARVIDADILQIDKTRVILWGVDAPERSQTCILNGQLWGCYDVARRTLEELASRGKVSCVLIGKPDPFHRYFGVCESGGEDIGGEMVRRGMALAFTQQSKDYADIQTQAITKGVGLWQPGVQFEEPWVWRHEHTPGGYR